MFGFLRKPKEYYVMPAQTGDWPELARIHKESFSNAWSAGDLERLAASKGTKVWLARPQGKGSSPPHGFVIVRNAADEAEIITIGTASRHRKKGAARALMHHVIRELRNERMAKLFLEVSSANMPALDLYNSLGFRRSGMRKAYYSSASEGSGEAADALVMELVLR